MFDQHAWCKSSYSGPNGGDCVEINQSPLTQDDDLVGIRDSKAPHEAELAVSGRSWRAFLAGVTSGQLPTR